MPRKPLVLLLSVVFWTGQLLSQPVKSSSFHQSGRTLLAGTARIQFLSPTLLRLEQSGPGTFADAPTAVVQNRTGEPVAVTAREENGWLVAAAGNLTVRYRLNSGAFARENLRILWKDSAGEHRWTPGDSDRANLGGISYSLDGAQKGRLPSVPPGMLSRSGYFLLDDSRTPLWDSAASWIIPRVDSSGQDWYFFTEGSGFKHLLKEYATLCGTVPMIPRYTLGAWITDLNYEYVPGTSMVDDYRYTDEDIRNIIEHFRRESIPLDILVLDFAWHKYGWDGGYDWSPIFPDPARFLAWAHEQGLHVTLNDHPGYDSERVLSEFDSHTPEIRKRLNLPVSPAPKYSLDLTRGWRFNVDPADEGLRERWFASDYSDSSWDTLIAGEVWEEQGHPNYDGVGWYRKRVSIPRETGSDSLYLFFGGVDDEYDLFIDGKKIAHFGSREHSVFGTPTKTEISHLVERGGETLIALRVMDWGGGGGLSKRPALITDRVPQGGIHFNLADKRQAQVFMDVLHNPLVDQGVDFWWIDGGSGAAAMPGLNPQMWTNRVFYDLTQ
ncbi:MAG TPA: TIM-barrel domain-containing protein, partial [Bacteroidota bacterium]